MDKKSRKKKSKKSKKNQVPLEILKQRRKDLDRIIEKREG